MKSWIPVYASLERVLVQYKGVPFGRPKLLYYSIGAAGVWDRGKYKPKASLVVWRCAIRIEEACSHFPTLNEELFKKALGEMVCEGGSYDEGVVRNNVDSIQVFDMYIMICFKDEQRLYMAYKMA